MKRTVGFILIVVAVLVLNACFVYNWFGSSNDRVIKITAYDKFGYQVYARVYMDGHLVGKTPWKGNPSLKEHDFELKNWKYPTWKKHADANTTNLVARFKRNVDTLSKECSEQKEWSCFWLSEELLSSYSSANQQVRQAVQRYQMLAARLASDSCNSGNKESCALLGYFYLTETGRAKDTNRAIELTKELCDTDKNMLACYVFGRAKVEQAEEKGENIDDNTIQRLNTSCNHPIPDACGFLAEAKFFMAFQNSNGEKVDTNKLDEALSSFEFACSVGSGYACGKLGEMYFKGSNVEENPYVAEPLIKKACNLLDGRGCYYMAQMIVNGFSEEALSPQELLQKACMIGYQKGCTDAQ